MDVSRYLVRIKRVLGIVQILTMGMLLVAALLLLLNSRNALDIKVFDASEHRVGEWLLNYPFHLYFREVGKLEIRENEKDGRYLTFINDSSAAQNYNGIGFYGPFSAPMESSLTILWRRRGMEHHVEVQLIDTPPSDAIGYMGEYFKFITQSPSSDWEELEMPLVDFVENSWQQPTGYLDGVLNNTAIGKIEIGLPQETEIELDIKTIRLIRKAATPLNLILLLVMLPLPFFLLLRTSSLSPGKSQNLMLRTAAGRRTALFFLAAALLTQLLVRPESFHNLWLDLGFLTMALVLTAAEALPRRVHKKAFLLHIPLVLLLVFWFIMPVLHPLAFGLLTLTALVHPLFLRRRFHFLLQLILITTAIVTKDIFYTDISGIYYYIALGSAAILGFSNMEFFALRSASSEGAQSLHLYNSLLNYSPDAIFTVSVKGEITGINKGLEEMLKAPREEILKWKLSRFLKKDLPLEEKDPVERQSVRRYDARIISRTKQSHDVYICEHPIYRNGVLNGYQFIATDITERKKMEEELKEANRKLQALVNIDGLTGVYNRRYFDQQLDIEWRRGCRNKKPLSLILMDIDFFKPYNDTYGHQQGDSCLKQVAGTLNTRLNRASDLLARYGGEEFIVILPSTNSENAVMVAERLRTAIEELQLPHKGSPDHKVVTISLGVSSQIPICKAKWSPKTLIEKADQALYRAKAEGRNRLERENFDDRN